MVMHKINLIINLQLQAKTIMITSIIKTISLQALKEISIHHLSIQVSKRILED